MKQYFIKQGTSDRLLLIFTGWASDERLFLNYSGIKEDLCVCSDYRTWELNTEFLSRYKEIRVIAWSLGVFVANKVLANQHLPISEATALNGTLRPIDDQEGIPLAIYNGTEQHLSAENLLKFYRRMCADSIRYREFLQHTVPASIPELQDALRNIRTTQENEINYSEQTIFTNVIIGLSDRIFPPENQKQAWRNFPSVRMEKIAHYDENIWNKLIYTR